MTKQLKDMKVAIVVDDLFEQAELAEPKKALEAAGVTVHIVAPKGPTVTGMKHHDKGDSFPVTLAQAFAKSIDEAGKPLAVVCHGPWLLISAGIVSGRTLTSWPTLQDDLRNAGATWVDKEVVSDGNWTSSRKPADLPAFNRAFIDALQREPARQAETMPIAD
ncbi:MAG: type 1 glutamine amidotransferase [Burkholderiales bacterium]|nr:type 1 glutamine amidotransferase [Burkholderiales bacterium]